MLRALSIGLFICISLTSTLLAQPQIGKLAPDFIGLNTKGQLVDLKHLRGKNVVLEWTNHECPYVRKHYNSGNMQKTQAALTADGVYWISVISSAPDKQGYVTPEKADALTASRGSYADTVVIDASGSLGKTFSARTTPQIVLIDEAGIIRYQGAIDDKPSSRASSLKGAKNYLLAAWGDLKAGRNVTEPITKPYGCTIKYADVNDGK